MRSSIAERLEPRTFFSVSYTASVIGNSVPQANLFAGSDSFSRSHVQEDVDGMWVSPDGTVFTTSSGDENHVESGVYKNGNFLGALQATQGYGRGNGLAITGNSNYVYLAQQQAYDPQVQSNASGLPYYPPSGTTWFVVHRYANTSPYGGAGFAGGYGFDGAMLLVNTNGAMVDGLAADDGHLFMSDPSTNQIKVYDANTMTFITSWSLPRAGATPGAMTTDASGNLWVIEKGDASNPAQILRYSASGQLQLTITISAEMNPVALSMDPSGRLLVADDGPDQNIKIYDPGNLNGSPTAFAGTFGIQGGAYAGTGAAIGTAGPLRFDMPTGIGADAAGNLYVSFNGQGPKTGDPNFNDQGLGAQIESYTPAGSLNWASDGLEFVTTAAADPSSPSDVYTSLHHYTINYNQTSGQDWVLDGYTYDAAKYPDDFRLNADNTDRGSPVIREIDGQKFMFLTDMYSNELAIYRFDPATDGEVAIPSGFIAKTHINASWIPNEPASGEWIWRDSNGNGNFDPGEFTQAPGGGDAPWSFGWTVDNNGNIYQALMGTAGIREFQFQGLDAQGNPIYDYAHITTIPTPAPFTDLERIQYDSTTDTMYLAGYTAAQPSDTWGAFKVIAKYDNWSSGSPELEWTITPPYDNSGDSSGLIPKSMAVSGNDVFVSFFQWGGPAEIMAYDATTGAALGTITPTAAVGGVAGDTDITQGLTATHLSDGRDVLFAEDDRYGRVVMYTVGTAVPPTSTPPDPAPAPSPTPVPPPAGPPVVPPVPVPPAPIPAPPTVPPPPVIVATPAPPVAAPVPDAPVVASLQLTDTDIGSPVIAGAETLSGTTWTVFGGGTGIGSRSDQINLAAESSSQDGAIIAEVTSLSKTSAAAFAGVMFRDSAAASAAFVDVVATARNGVCLQWRSKTGGHTNSIHLGRVPAPGAATPAWLKLVRAGNEFTALYSADGTKWRQVARSQNVALAADALAGLTVSSHEKLKGTSATFSNVSIAA
jgi:hypothetical protein